MNRPTFCIACLAALPFLGTLRPALPAQEPVAIEEGESYLVPPGRQLVLTGWTSHDAPAPSTDLRVYTDGSIFLLVDAPRASFATLPPNVVIQGGVLVQVEAGLGMPQMPARRVFGTLID